MIDPCKHAGPDCRGKVSHAACGCGYVAARCEAHGGRQQAEHSLGCHMVWHRRGKPLDENAYTQIRRILHGLLAEGGPPSLLVALADLDTIERTMAWAQRLHGAACHLLASVGHLVTVGSDGSEEVLTVPVAAVEVLRAALTRSQKEKTVT